MRIAAVDAISSLVVVLEEEEHVVNFQSVVGDILKTIGQALSTNHEVCLTLPRDTRVGTSVGLLLCLLHELATLLEPSYGMTGTLTKFTTVVSLSLSLQVSTPHQDNGEIYPHKWTSKFYVATLHTRVVRRSNFRIAVGE